MGTNGATSKIRREDSIDNWRRPSSDALWSMTPDEVQSAPIEWQGQAQMRSTRWGTPTLASPVSTEKAAVTAPMSANEALEMAARRGLELQRSDNQSGYKHVVINRAAGKDRMFQLQVRGDGQQTHLGSFATPEEAALQYVMREVGSGVVMIFKWLTKRTEATYKLGMARLGGYKGSPTPKNDEEKQAFEKGLKVGIEDEVAEVRLPGQPFNKYEFNQ